MNYFCKKLSILDVWQGSDHASELLFTLVVRGNLNNICILKHGFTLITHIPIMIRKSLIAPW